MKNKKEIGLDKWKLPGSLLEISRIIQMHDLEMYDLQEHVSYTIGYVPVFQRRKMQHLFENAVLLTTTGMLGYFFRTIKKPTRLAGIFVALAMWFALSGCIYDIDIKGEDEAGKQLIEAKLKEMNICPPFYQKDVLALKQDLKKSLENKIAWLEIEKLGSRYKISYTPKEFAHIEKLKHDELIAQKDGVIQRFDVSHGNKLHKVNEFVHKGDVLVSNVIDTSSNAKQEVFVKGRVYAFTWKDVTVEMKDDKMPKSFQYFSMLLKARSEISDSMLKDDRIEKENILQFSKELGKIKMVIHYTLIQDITTPHT